MLQTFTVLFATKLLYHWLHNETKGMAINGVMRNKVIERCDIDYSLYIHL